MLSMKNDDEKIRLIDTPVAESSPTFIRNRLGEIPVIGPFFIERRLKKAVKKSLHECFMLMGGVLMMAINLFHLKPKTFGGKIGSGIAHMVVGMWLGTVAYHTTEYTVGKIASCLNLSDSKAADKNVAHTQITRIEA
jgi:hypothetical protein